MASNKQRYRSRGGLQREYRFLNPESLEVRDGGKSAPDSIILTGKPIQYDTPYSVRDSMGEFQETMRPGVMKDLIGTCACRFLITHTGMPLARTLSGTLTLEDTPTALAFTANLDARQQLANDLAVAIERGDITQMSCGFIVGDCGDKWSSDWQTRDVYSFKDFVDVSAVTYPASPTTTIEVIQRMVAQIEESEIPWSDQVRMRKMWNIAVDLRAGAVLNKANAAHVAGLLGSLKTANDHLNALATAGGVEAPGETAASDGSGSNPNPTADTTVTSDSNGLADGSIGGAVSGVPNGNGPGIGSQDGAGSRAHVYTGPDLIGFRAENRKLFAGYKGNPANAQNHTETASTTNTVWKAFGGSGSDHLGATSHQDAANAHTKASADFTAAAKQSTGDVTTADNAAAQSHTDAAAANQNAADTYSDKNSSAEDKASASKSGHDATVEAVAASPNNWTDWNAQHES